MSAPFFDPSPRHFDERPTRSNYGQKKTAPVTKENVLEKHARGLSSQLEP
jgi:hypothetical protein